MGKLGRRRAQLRQRRRRGVRRTATDRAGRASSSTSPGDASASTPTCVPRGATAPLVRSHRSRRGVLGPVGAALGVPGAAQGRARRRRPRRSDAAWASAAALALWDRRFTADDLRSIREHEGAGRDRGRPPGHGRPGGEARPGRHPRHRVRRAAAAARARPGRPRAALAHDARRRSPRCGRAGTSRRTTPVGLADAYRFLRTVEHRLQLGGRATDPHRSRRGSRRTPSHGPGARLPRHAANRVPRTQFDARPRRASARVRPNPRTALLPTAARGALAGGVACSPRCGRRPAGRASASPTPTALGPGGARADPWPHPLVAPDAAAPPAAARLAVGRRPTRTWDCWACASWRRVAARDQSWPTPSATVPEVARRLCQLLGTSGLLGDVLAANPDLIAAAGRRRPPADAAQHAGLADAADERLDWRTDVDEPPSGPAALAGPSPVRCGGPRRVRGRPTWRRCGADLVALAEASARGRAGLARADAAVRRGRHGPVRRRRAVVRQRPRRALRLRGLDTGRLRGGPRVAAGLLRFCRRHACPADLRHRRRPAARGQARGRWPAAVDGYAAYYERWALSLGAAGHGPGPARGRRPRARGALHRTAGPGGVAADRSATRTSARSGA